MNGVPRPRPSAANCREPAIPPGPDHLRLLALRFIGRRPIPIRNDMSAWRRKNTGECFNLGTLCSGTELPILAFVAWAAALEERVGAGPRWFHSMGAECNTKKQELILTMFPSLHTLTNVHDLSAASAPPAPHHELTETPDNVDMLCS